MAAAAFIWDLIGWLCSHRVIPAAGVSSSMRDTGNGQEMIGWLLWQNGLQMNRPAEDLIRPTNIHLILCFYFSS